MSEAETEPQTEQEYARIVTNHAEMRDVLGKIRMKGTDTDGQTVSLVKDVILTFEDGQVKTTVFDPMKSVWANVEINFDGIKREGELVIGDVSDFLKYLKRFGDKTIVEQGIPEDENVVHLEFNDEQRKVGGYPATDEEHIDSVQDVDKLPYDYDPENHDCPGAHAQGKLLDSWFECNVADIKSVLEDGDTTQVRTYPINVEDGTVQVRVGDTNGYIETSFEAEDGEGDAASIFGYGMDNVFSNISGNVTVFLSDDNPMWVYQDTDEYTVHYMIAEDQA